MKTKKTIGIISISLFMFIGANTFAQRGQNYSDQGKGIRQSQACRMIPGLTEDQQVKIEALRVVHLKEMTAYRNQKNELRAKKQTLMSSDNSDMKELNVVIDQMTNLQNKMMKSSAKHRQDIRSLLTADQKVYFDSKPHGRQGKMNQGNRNGRGPGRGLNPDCPNNN